MPRAQSSSAPSCRGFTFAELLMVLAIIGILAAIALPMYQRQVNEARAAQVLANIHRISLAYHDVLAQESPAAAELPRFASPGLGQPPPEFTELAPLFDGPEELQLSAHLANHSGYFRFATEGLLPVLFVKAPTGHALQVLHALDHVLDNEHVFVRPDLMVIALRSHRAAAATPAGTGAASGVATGGPAPQPVVAAPVAGTSGAGGDTATPPSTGTVAAAGGTSDTTPGSVPGSTTAATSTGAAGGDATRGAGGATGSDQVPAAHPNWPPGWVKHPWQHTGSHGHSNN